MKLWKRIIAVTLTICAVLTLGISSANAASYVTKIAENGVYYIQHVGSKKYLDITDESTSNGARLQIWSKYSNHQNQVFIFRKVGDYWKIIAHHSGKAIEVRDSSMSDYAHVSQWDYAGIACQQWKAIYNSDGTVSFCNRNSGKYLDVYGNGNANGTKLIQYSRNGTNAQKFKLYRLYNADILNANWTRSFSTSEISWTQYGINSNVYNFTRFRNGSKFPTPNHTYLTKVEYIDRETVWRTIRNKSLDQSILEQIADVIEGEGKEAAAARILAELGFNDVPCIGIAVGICEILFSASSSSEWNKFVRAVQYDGYGNTGVIKKTYVTITKQPYWGPLNNGTGAWGWNYRLIETKSYTYTSWNGNGGISNPNYNGYWKYNFK